MNAVNDSETGRLRRKSDSDGGEGVPVPPPIIRCSLLVARLPLPLGERDGVRGKERTWDSKPTRTLPVEEKSVLRTPVRVAGFGGEVKRRGRRSSSVP